MRSLLLLVMALTSGCPAPTKPTPPPDKPGDADPTARAGGEKLTVEQVVGYYSGDWGQMILRPKGYQVLGVYSHDQGTLVMEMDQDQVLRGWWTEAPTRAPSKDAGEVEFAFKHAGDDLAIDGRWRYGVDGGWREDWDVQRVKDAPPADLEARFAAEDTFFGHPE